MVTGDNASHGGQDSALRAATDGSHSYGATDNGSHALQSEQDHGRDRQDGVTYREYSGQGEGLKNFVLMGGGMITILASFWLFASYPNSFWLFLLGIIVYGVALAVPTAIFPGSTAKHSTGGTDITMDLPSNDREKAHRPGVPQGAQVNH